MPDEDGRRKALVTGGTGAVGAATCRLLADAGQDVSFTYRSNATLAAELLADLQSAGSNAVATAIDLTNADAVDELVASTVATHGRLDVLVHAAGPHIPQRYFSSLDRKTFDHHVDNETGAFFNLISAALPHLRESQGAVVAVTTVGVRQYPVRDVLSAAPKAAIEAMVRAVAAEEGRYGVRANCVGPGILADGIGGVIHDDGDFPLEAREFAMKRVPLRKFGRGADVAEAVVFMASEKARYITGQSLDVDGGFSI